MEPLIVIGLICGGISAAVASSRGASAGLWFVLGFLFGPLGLLLSFLSGSGRNCPFCRKAVHREATKCPYCQSVVPPHSGVAQSPVIAHTEQHVDAAVQKWGPAQTLAIALIVVTVIVVATTMAFSYHP